MLSRKSIGMTIAVTLLFVGSTTWGTAYYVDPGGSDDANGLSWATAFATIGKSITTGGNGDTVDVNQGTYYESINFSGKSIHIRSTDPNDSNVIGATIIDANSPSTDGVIFNSSEDANSVLEGFTVTGGRYGIYAPSSSPSPTITKCYISGNSSYGIYFLSCGTPTVSRCRIINNQGTYGVIVQGQLTLQNCVVAKNSSTGVRRFGGGPLPKIIGCTIYGNGSWGVSGDCNQITNCIVWGNTNDDLYLTSCQATYSCIEDQSPGTGNIHVLPMFVDEDSNDFHLRLNSLCIDAGDPCSGYSNEPGSGGGRINMGAYGNTSEATTRTDTDNDDMADEWETANGFDPNDANDGTQDLDGDGLRNKDEYHIDWDPNDSNSIDGIVHNTRNDYNYPTIGLAVSLAFNSDTLIMDANTFYELVDFKGKPIHLKGTDPNDANTIAATVIDANDITKDAVTFNSGEGATTILEGITFTGGRYGIYFPAGSTAASPVIRKCIIRGNDSHGVYCYNNGTPTFFRCTAISNGGFGLLIYGPEITISNCIAAKNSGGGIRLFGAPKASVASCTVANNSSYGIQTPSREIKDCIIWNNGDDLYSSTAQVTYSCIEDGDSGWGTFSADPCFVNADNNDFHLAGWSVCIDRGDPCSAYSNEPSGGGGRINMGAYGNTDEAATTTDDDGDSIADEWEEHYWPGDDPNQHDPNDDPDSDGFANKVEYLFGYDPNTATTPSMEVIAFLSGSQIDPTQGETATISYYVSLDANSDISFTNTDDASKTPRTVSQTATAGPLNQATWDGTDANGLVVERYFYNVTIDANDGDGNSTSWTSPPLWTSYGTGGTVDVNSNDLNAYKNIPCIFTLDMPDWSLPEAAIREDYPMDSDVVNYVVKDRLIEAGQSTFYWYGRWGTDVNDPNAGSVLEGNFWYSFYTGGGVKNGAIVVYYDDLLLDLRCNPYRIIPTYDEVATISYDLVDDANVTIDVYDPDGQYFGTVLDDAAQSQGSREVVWFGTDGDPNDANSVRIATEGAYRVEVEVENANISDKLEGTMMAYR